MPQPITIIHSRAPIRICDCGGWTDTWFAEYGSVLNIAVAPYAEARIEVFAASDVEHRVVIRAENFGDEYPLTEQTRAKRRHPLLETAIDHMPVPDNVAVRATVFSEAPAGASTGTSAAVLVALIGALDRLTPGRMTPHETAMTAHHVEHNLLGWQCGIQDQLCSAYGGVNYIEMDRFPHATVAQLRLPEKTARELERRLILVYLGSSHSSSGVHEKVIRELEGAGPDCAKLEDLRQAAAQARDALAAGDLEAFGRAMKDNTAAQGRLHPDIIGADARRVIQVAEAEGASGWKLNGAGGEGGSVTILCGEFPGMKEALIGKIQENMPGATIIPIHLCGKGLQFS